MGSDPISPSRTGPVSLWRFPKDITMDVVDLPLEQIIPYARNPVA